MASRRRRPRVASKKGIKKIVKRTIGSMAETKQKSEPYLQENTQLPHDLEWIRVLETISRGSESSQRIGKDIFVNHIKVFWRFKNNAHNRAITIKMVLAIDKTPTVGVTSTNGKFFESEASNYDPLDFINNFTPAGTGAPGTTKEWLLKPLNRKRWRILKQRTIRLGPAYDADGPNATQTGYSGREYEPEKVGTMSCVLNKKFTFDDTTSSDLIVLPSLKLMWWYEWDMKHPGPSPGLEWSTIDPNPTMDHGIRIRTRFKDM